MGWSYGHNTEGREIGYGVLATCDYPKCIKQIDRGIACACRECHDCDEDHKGVRTCGSYFCPAHREDHDCDAEPTGVIIGEPCESCPPKPGSILYGATWKCASCGSTGTVTEAMKV